MNGCKACHFVAPKTMDMVLIVETCDFKFEQSGPLESQVESDKGRLCLCLARLGSVSGIHFLLGAISVCLDPLQTIKQENLHTPFVREGCLASGHKLALVQATPESVLEIRC